VKRQNFEIENDRIRELYLKEKHRESERFTRRIDLSWSVWMFGLEPIENSLERLKRNRLDFVELKGDVSMEVEKVRSALERYDMALSGVCGLFSPERDLSSPDVDISKRAIEYIFGEIDFLSKFGGKYMIVVPGAVGRPEAIDSQELERSAKNLKTCAKAFSARRVAAAIEPIRSAEVSIVHTTGEAIDYIASVDEPAIAHLNGDIYHMLNEERHIGRAILECGNRLVNLHIADSNRDAPGKGMIDIDTVIMASYLVGMNRPGRFLTFEPLGPYPDPYVLSTQPCNVDVMEKLVSDSVSYFREREEIVRSL